jgi:hypothetical protein
MSDLSKAWLAIRCVNANIGQAKKRPQTAQMDQLTLRGIA